MDKFTYDFKQLLAQFQQTWVEREAFRIMRKIETAGETANWENVLQGAQTLAQGIFQPALEGLETDPLHLVVERLLERLSKHHK